MKIRSISLDHDLDAQAKAAALRKGLKYSDWARQVFERALAAGGDSGQAAAIADSDNTKAQQ